MDGAPPVVVSKEAPSLLFNNLSSNGSVLSYVHDSQVILASVSKRGGPTIEKVPFKDNTPVRQVKWCKLRNQWYLVVTNTVGLQIWNAEGSQMIFLFLLQSEIQISEDEQSFCRGVAAVDGPITGSASDQLCVGASNGDIFIFTVEDDTVEFSRTIRFHTSAVTSMASSVDFVACADDDGQISLWTAQGMAKHCAFDGFGHPCTAVATRRDLVIGSYSTGHIRLFSSRTQSITAEIMAHSRCINALELHPSHMTFFSVGEDTMINMWQTNENGSEVSLTHSERVDDKLLCGIAFLEGGEKVAASSYDSDVINCWTC